MCRTSANGHPANGGLGATPGLPYRAYRQGAGQPRAARYEESPGSTKQGWRVTPAVGNHRESATESIPPMARSRDQARVKGCGKSAPGLRQRGPHGKPHPEQGRIGAARPRKRAGAFRIDRPGWLLELRSNPKPRRMAAPAWLVCKHTARGTEPGLQAPWQFSRKSGERDRLSLHSGHAVSRTPDSRS